MSLTHTPHTAPAAAASPEDPEQPFDEIIDLTDRRRVMLHAVLGVDVDPDTADAVFASIDLTPSPPGT